MSVPAYNKILFHDESIDRLVDSAMGKFGPSPVLVLPRQDFLSLRIQMCTSSPFTLSGLGAPTANQLSMASYTDIPILLLKTEAEMEAEEDEYTDSAEGYLTDDTDWHSLALGRISFPLQFDADTPAGEYFLQLCLLGSDGSTRRVPVDPRNWPVTIPVRVVTGDESIVTVPHSDLNGTFQINNLATSSDPVTVVGLTAATGNVNVWQRRSTGGKVSFDPPVIIDGSFTIAADSFPGNGLYYEFGYHVEDL